jgi:phage shock protein C
MSISDDLTQLGDLHQRGVLSDDEFAQAKARVLGDTPARNGPDPALAAVNALRRSRSDRWIGGVCGGLAQMSGLATWIWRLMFALFALCGGAGVVIYVLLWIFVPKETAYFNQAPGSAQPG